MAVETQIAHSTRKRDKATKTQEETAKSKQDIQARVDRMQAELLKVKNSADEASGRRGFASSVQPLNSHTEAQRQASQHNMALTEDSLEEYRKL